MESFEDNSHKINKKRFKKKREKEVVEEKTLESIVFGKESNVLENINKKFKTEEKDSFDVFEDKSGEHEMPVLLKESYNSSDSDSSEDINYTKSDYFSELKDSKIADIEEIPKNEEKKKKTVWTDEDDNIDVKNALDINILPKRVDKNDKYKQYLVNKFTDIYKTPKWAQINHKNKAKDSDSSDESKDSDDEDVGRIAQRFKLKSNKLEKGFLPFRDCVHLTKNKKMKASLNCVEFNPTSAMALVSSPKGIVSLFEVNGKNNNHIQTIDFKDFKIESAKFSKNGKELIVGSKRELGFYYYYDMIAGKIVRIPFIKGKEKFSLEKFVLSNDHKFIASKADNGFVKILTTKTKEHIFDFKMNGEVMSLAFSEDSNYLLTHGNGGKAYVWDMRKRQCINRFLDEGCVVGTSIALSPNSEYCCTGSDMGVVNVYKLNDILTKPQPKPLKSLMNLTTEVSLLKFNHSSELLVMLSKEKDNSIKCVHMNSLTVFSNFPNSAKIYGRIYDSDISLNSGYLTFATNGGTAYLYRLLKYNEY